MHIYTTTTTMLLQADPLTMTLSLDDIKKPIDSHLRQFERHFWDSMRNNRIPLLNTILRYVFHTKGKQMRPMFVFLAAKLQADVTDATYRGASLIELLHTASLIHDDVVDDAYERRGFFSISALWKNKVAVLLGDYLLSKGLLLAIDNGDFKLLQIVSRAVKEMSEGELLQIERTRRLNLDETVYYEIIRQKTASLIASACAVGYASANPGDTAGEQLAWTMGEKIGMAFQIKDDLFDFGNEKTGKPKGNDIQEKKVTLPLLYAINNASSSDRKRIVYLIKNHGKDRRKIEEVVSFVNQSGGIDYAQQAMYCYRTEAIDMLRQYPVSAARQSLEQLIVFTTERNK